MQTSKPWVITSVELSTNGTDWSTVWQNNTNTPRDEEWTHVEHDLATLADGQSQVYVRWGHTVTTTDAYPQSGWNIDDIELQAVPDKQLRLLLPAGLTEGGSTGTGTLMVAPAPGANLIISLNSNRSGEEVSFPASVTILAGQTEASFIVTPINDTRIDGSQNVILTAGAATWPNSSATMQVHDNETTMLTLTLPASVTEGASSITNQARINLPAAAVVPITVILNSSDPGELELPASVTIPQGRRRYFSRSRRMPEDALIDGSQNVNVTASVTNWPNANAVLQVLDNEGTQLAVSLTSPTLENAGVLAGGGLVSVPGTLVNALTVTLNSSDVSELTLPASVVIPSGASQAMFDLTLVNDPLADGDQSVMRTSTAPGFTTGTGAMIVSDDEQPAMPVTPVPAHLNSPTHPESDLAWSYDAASGMKPRRAMLFCSAHCPRQLSFSILASFCGAGIAEAGAGHDILLAGCFAPGCADASGASMEFHRATSGCTASLRVVGCSCSSGAWGSFARVVRSGYDEWDNEVTGFTGLVNLSACAQAAPTTTGTGTYAWFYPLAAELP